MTTNSLCCTLLRAASEAPGSRCRGQRVQRRAASATDPRTTNGNGDLRQHRLPHIRKLQMDRQRVVRCTPSAAARDATCRTPIATSDRAARCRSRSRLRAGERAVPVDDELDHRRAPVSGCLLSQFAVMRRMQLRDVLGTAEVAPAPTPPRRPRRRPIARPVVCVVLAGVRARGPGRDLGARDRRPRRHARPPTSPASSAARPWAASSARRSPSAAGAARRSSFPAAWAAARPAPHAARRPGSSRPSSRRPRRD